MMKRMCVALLLFALITTMCSCSKIEESGLDNYDPQTCSVELTGYLFPQENFLSLFQYEDGDYHYLDSGDLVWGYAKAFAYLSYDSETYEKAKEFCMNHFVPCEDHAYEYRGYQFQEHLCHKVKQENSNLSAGCDVPKHFNMFGYHDESCTLFFIGYYNGDPESEERMLAEADFEVFLKTVYADCYNFEA